MLTVLTCLQALLFQEGKLYGRDPIFLVICKASALPESMKDIDIQKNEAVVQLGQVMYQIYIQHLSPGSNFVLESLYSNISCGKFTVYQLVL